MKTFLISLLIFFATTAQETDHYDILCVSLGWNCQVAAKLRDNGLRQFSFPCDWNQTPYSGLCALIQNSFEDLLNPTYLIYKAPKAAGIFNTKYNVALSHAFPTYVDSNDIRKVVENYLDFLPEVSETYERRIARFYNICTMADFVYFFRQGSNSWHYDTYVNKHTITHLRNILLEVFPHKNWLLVVIHNNNEYQEDWEIPMVKNMHMPTKSGDVHSEWKIILEKIGLKK